MRSRLGVSAPPDDEIRGAIWTAAALAMTTAVIVVAFVWPHWAEYQFYNWQMSVARKPSYDLRSLIDRASWIPVVQDFFTRMWVELVAAAVAIGGVVVRWRDARPAERLLALWVVVGLAELVAHDSGNERRYVMFIPAVIAMASPVFSGTARTAWTRLKSATRADLLLAAPVLLALAYVVVASALAPFLVVRTAEHPYSDTVRVSAAVGLVLTVALLARWTQVIAWLSDRRVPAWVIAGMVAGILLWNLGLYGRWAVARSELNYEASVKLGALLPPETLVQGKLANGLALENRIRPLFVGRGFGNYEDRFERDDARYILTYGLPREGYESQTGLIREILDRYPNRRLVATFDLDETPALDQAWLIEKTPAGVPAAASGSNRAPD